MPEKIQIEDSHDGRVRHIVLDSPKGNVIDSAMMSEISAALSDLPTGVVLVVFRSSGKHFSFGASVEEHTKDRADGMLTQFHGLFLQLADLAVPTAAVVSGQCLGGALELVLMCNFLFADESARMGQPEINLGVFAPPASILLPLKVGMARAEDLLLSGRSITAKDALDWGLATAVYPDRESLDSGVTGWIEEHIAKKSASSLRFAVRAARLEFNHDFRRRLEDLQRLYISELMETHDANEGIQAFLEKRSPVWEGSKSEVSK